MTREVSYLKLTIKWLSAAGLGLTVVLCAYGYTLGIFTSPDALSGLLSRVGFWAPLVFILLQIVQVVVPIIPGAMGCVAGVLIFGPLYGFIYNYIGICIGSVINFLVARAYGTPFVKAMVNENTYNKYIGWLDEKNRFTGLFAFAIFMPVAPDDFLCMLAGLTNMKLRTFIAIILLCKPLSIFAYSATLALSLQWLARLAG